MGAFAMLECLVEQTNKARKPQLDSKIAVHGSDIGGLCALTKVASASALEQAVRECQQIMGARGYSKDGPGARIERISRDVRTLVVGGGSEEILSELAVTQEGKDLLALQAQSIQISS